MIKVAKKTAAAVEDISALERASSERQFKKAVDDTKKTFPPVLLIDGHNPVALLHHALSQGIHAESDDECLAIATSIRVVLTELAVRMSQVLRDHASLKKAVARLQNPPPKGE